MKSGPMFTIPPPCTPAAYAVFAWRSVCVVDTSLIIDVSMIALSALDIFSRAQYFAPAHGVSTQTTDCFEH